MKYGHVIYSLEKDYNVELNVCIESQDKIYKKPELQLNKSKIMQLFSKMNNFFKPVWKLIEKYYLIHHKVTWVNKSNLMCKYIVMNDIFFNVSKFKFFHRGLLNKFIHSYNHSVQILHIQMRIDFFSWINNQIFKDPIFPL